MAVKIVMTAVNNVTRQAESRQMVKVRDDGDRKASDLFDG
jgi:hypothetical protein